MRESFSKKNSKALDYVKNKIEKEASPVALSQYMAPLFKDISYSESGTIDGKVGDMQITLTYAPDGSKTPDPGIRNIISLVLKNKEMELDLGRLLPPNFSIYFTSRIDEKDTSFDSTSSKGLKVILVNFPLLSKLGLITLMHEVGHIISSSNESYITEVKKTINKVRLLVNEKSLSEKILTGFKAPQIADAESVLRDERNAWSVCFNLLRPFLKDLNVSSEDLSNITHKFALQGYSDFIKMKLKDKLD